MIVDIPTVNGWTDVITSKPCFSLVRGLWRRSQSWNRIIERNTSLCPVSSSRLPDPRASGPGNLTMTWDFSLLGPAPNPAYYLGVSVISSETNMYYQCNRASGYTIFKVFVPFSVSGKRTQICRPEVQRLSATYSCP